MSEVLMAILEPLGKVLLEIWLSRTIERISGRRRAEIARRARELANIVADDIAGALGKEGLTEKVVLPAATELGATLGEHLDTSLLIRGQLKADAVERVLLEVRPVSSFYKEGEPEKDAYLRLVSLLSPRLCAMAPELPDYSQLRDSVILSQMAQLVENAPTVLAKFDNVQASVEEVRQEIKRTRNSLRAIERDTGRTTRIITQAARREDKEKAAFASAYRKAVRETLDYVEILGLPELGPGRREAKLTVAYLSLTTNIAGIGRLSYERLLDLLPILGGRLLIEGAAGSGKSTLLRWTAVQASLGNSEEISLQANDLKEFTAWRNFLGSYRIPG